MIADILSSLEQLLLQVGSEYQEILQASQMILRLEKMTW